MAAKSIADVGAEDLVQVGLSPEEAASLHRQLEDAIALSRRHPPGLDPPVVWREITARKLLKPTHPHALHRLLYRSVYSNYDESSSGPPLFWFPSLLLLLLESSGFPIF
ncbi:unnamed protein product [Cuscuta campestris]|uniref:Uncharacterized protein n=1 Tax=Cuscuta campestris TaxID=132261 RepID=A0A484K317_9ASTE|nr:unnamed protein product [Cuscuta campestris]